VSACRKQNMPVSLPPPPAGQPARPCRLLPSSSSHASRAPAFICLALPFSLHDTTTAPLDSATSLCTISALGVSHELPATQAAAGHSDGPQRLGSADSSLSAGIMTTTRRPSDDRAPELAFPDSSFVWGREVEVLLV